MPCLCPMPVVFLDLGMTGILCCILDIWVIDPNEIYF